MIREFKERNPLQFKRIKAFPMKARTGRRAADDNANSTIVFLRSPYKSEFYKTSADGEPTATGAEALRTSACLEKFASLVSSPV